MGLAVQVSGDIGPFEKAMKAARVVADKSSAEIATSFITASTKINRGLGVVDAGLGGITNVARGAGLALAGLAIGAAAFKAIGVAVEAAKEQVAEFTKIADRARQAGVGTTFLQAWEGQARSLGLELDVLTQALNRAREAGTVRIGEGGEASESAIRSRLGSQQAAGNIGAGDLRAFDAATNQEARVRAVLDLVQRLLDAGKELAAYDIAGKMFGPKFEDAARRGVDIVGQLRAELDKPTVKIFDEGEIGRAEQLNQRLNEAQRVMANGMKPIMDDLARLGVNHHESWVAIAERVAAAAKWAGDLYAAVSKIPDLFAKMGNAPFFTTLNRWMEGKGFTGGTGPGLEYVDADRATAEDQLRRGLSNAGTVRNAGQQSLEMARAVIPDRSNPLPPPRPRAGAGAAAGSGTERLDDVEQFIRGLERSNALLETEIKHFGKSNAERQVAVALVKLNAEAKDRLIPATEKEIADTTRLAQENAKLKSTYEDLEKAQRASAEAMRYLGEQAADAFADMIIDGKKASDVIASLARSLSRSLLQGALTGGGSLGGLFGGAGANGAAGGLIGAGVRALGIGARAAGGPISAGRPYMVGERGPELMVPQMSGNIVPNNALPRGGGGAITVQIVNNVDATGADPASHARMLQGLEAVNKSVETRAVRAVAEARGRGLI